MNAPFDVPMDADNLNLMKFGIGQPVHPPGGSGPAQGPGPLHRRYQPAQPGLCRDGAQPVAHGIINGIDTAAAKEMPGVLGVWTGADLNAAGYGPLKTLIPVPNRDGSPMKTPVRHSLATDKVRFVGDPVAFVVAETLAEAKDAAEAVELDIESLPAVTDAARCRRARRAAPLRRRARQHRARLPLRRRRQGGRGFRQGRACRAPAAGQQPHRGLRHGAALGDRRL